MFEAFIEKAIAPLLAVLLAIAASLKDIAGSLKGAQLATDAPGKPAAASAAPAPKADDLGFDDPPPAPAAPVAAAKPVLTPKEFKQLVRPVSDAKGRDFMRSFIDKYVGADKTLNDFKADQYEPFLTDLGFKIVNGAYTL